MSAPLTKTQIAVDSILDLNGKQTYLGNSFSLPMLGLSFVDTAEYPVCLIRNPSGSGKSIFLFNTNVSTNNNPLAVRYYFNPTVNIAGATRTPINLRSGSTTSTVSLCYLGSTFSSNGTLLSLTQSTISSSASEVLRIIDQGDSLLITAQQSGTGTSVVVSENAWYEI